MEGKTRLRAAFIKLGVNALLFKDLKNAITVGGCTSEQILEWVNAMLSLSLSAMDVSSGCTWSDMLHIMSKARTPHALVSGADPHACIIARHDAQPIQPHKAYILKGMAECHKHQHFQAEIWRALEWICDSLGEYLDATALRQVTALLKESVDMLCHLTSSLRDPESLKVHISDLDVQDPIRYLSHFYYYFII